MIWVLLAACGGGEVVAPAPVVDTGPVDGDLLVLAIPFDPDNVNPIVAPYVLSAWIQDLVQPGLVRRAITEEGLVYEPALAESFAWSDDGKALTYTLREGLVWEDGVALTSRDVQFTYALIADASVASNWAGDARFFASVEAPDPRTVVFRFTEQQNPLISQGRTIRGIVPEHVLKDADRATLRGHPSGRAPLASGPFRVASWEPDAKVVLEPNPKAPAEWKPHLKRVIFKVIPEHATRMLELHGGDVDLVPQIELDDLATVVADPALTVHRTPAASMSYAGYRNTDPRFADPRVRIALGLAVDRDKIIADHLSVDGVAYGQPCVGTIGPTSGAWYPSDLTPLPHDGKRAGELLTEAGWVDADRDGVREKGDQRLAFRLMVQTGTERLRKIAVLLQAYWAEIGARADIDMVEPTRFAVLAREHDFEAILWGFGNNPRIDETIYWRSDGQYNWMEYKNPAVDAAIDRGVSSTDVAVAQAAFQESERLVHADQPVTFLFWEDDLSGISKRFRDTDPNVFTPLNHLERWWVPTAEQKYR